MTKNSGQRYDESPRTYYENGKPYRLTLVRIRCLDILK